MLLLLFIVSIIYLSLQCWVAWGWLRIGRSSFSANKPTNRPLSVVICAHNEEANLSACLSSILCQDYPVFEVIVVLDRCTDGSLGVVESWVAQHSQLRILSIDETPDGWASKKYALTKGVEAASYEYLAFTDADCEVEEHWLKEIDIHFGTDQELVLGLGMYKSYGSDLLNMFIRFETFYAAYQYIGLARMGLPYMGVGRNLAYRRTFFFRHNGLQAFASRLSGDDDLMVNAYALPAQTTSMITRGSMTYSEPKRTLRTWLRQKLRHVSASTQYSLATKAFLGVFHMSHMMFYIILIAMLTLSPFQSLIPILYCIRILISWTLFNRVSKTIGEKAGLYLFPFLDFLFFLYNLVIVPLGLLKKPKWN